MVVIFDDLSSVRISRDGLLDAVPGTNPQFIDLSEIIAVQSEEGFQLSLAINQKRLESKLIFSNDDFSLENDTMLIQIPQVGRKGRESIDVDKIAGFGFNFFSLVEFAVEQDTRLFLIHQFSEPIARISHQLDASVVSIAPQLNYVKDGVSYQLNIRPQVSGGNQLSINFNIHFDLPELPEINDLETNFISGRDEFVSVVSRLFED